MKKLNALKLVALMLTTMLVVQPTIIAKAELTDSIGSDSSDESIGRDETQDKDTVYGDVNVNTSEHASQAEVIVYATKASKVQYRVPQVLIGDGSDGSATYKVGVKGDIASNQIVKIIPPESFVLTDGVRTATASISQPKKTWSYNDLLTGLDSNGYSIGIGTITFNIPAGSFSGSFNFDLTVEQQ